MKNKIGLLLSLIIISFSYAQIDKFNIKNFYPIDRSHSFISFSVTYMGFANVKGNFENFTGAFRFDQNDLLKTSVSFSLDVNSIDTNNDYRDKDLKSEDWFDAATYPKIYFVSRDVIQSNDGFNILGDLTIKGISKQVSLKIMSHSGILKDIRGDHQVIFTGSLEIDRKQFGVEGEKWSKIKEGIVGVSRIVKIEFSMLGKQTMIDNQLNWVKDESKIPGNLYKTYKKGGVESVIETINQIKKDVKFNKWSLYTVGNILMMQNKLKDALRIFMLNKDLFPKDSKTYEAIGETYALLNDLQNAKEYFKESMKLNNSNLYVSEILRHIK